MTVPEPLPSSLLEPGHLSISQEVNIFKIVVLIPARIYKKALTPVNVVHGVQLFSQWVIDVNDYRFQC